MNKAQLIDALAERLGDRRVAAAAVAGLIDLVVRTVNAGERVTITGFGVFEKRARAARTARNPRTGQAVTVQQTDVPAFRPGTLFREVVSGTRTLPGAGDQTIAQPSASPAPIDPAPIDPAPIDPAPAGATSRPAPRLSGAHVPPAKPAKTPKAGKPEKAVKAAKTVKASKIESKGAGKGIAKGPSKVNTKKSGKKSANKK